MPTSTTTPHFPYEPSIELPLTAQAALQLVRTEGLVDAGTLPASSAGRDLTRAIEWRLTEGRVLRVWCEPHAALRATTSNGAAVALEPLISDVGADGIDAPDPVDPDLLALDRLLLRPSNGTSAWLAAVAPDASRAPGTARLRFTLYLPLGAACPTCGACAEDQVC